jgi:hypothetical protein
MYSWNEERDKTRAATNPHVREAFKIEWIESFIAEVRELKPDYKYSTALHCAREAYKDMINGTGEADPAKWVPFYITRIYRNV